MFAMTVGASASDNYVSQVQTRKIRFLANRIDDWKAAGYPLVWREGKEWKFDEIEPCWAGAHAALLLKRSLEEIEKANYFFANAPVDWTCDPDMRMCKLLHSYYSFKNDPDLLPEAREYLLSLVTAVEAPRRIYKSSWSFHATENHARWDMCGDCWSHKSRVTQWKSLL